MKTMNEKPFIGGLLVGMGKPIVQWFEFLRTILPIVELDINFGTAGARTNKSFEKTD
jgi:hypothetical protein